jgi:hypothetical protein
VVQSALRVGKGLTMTGMLARSGFAFRIWLTASSHDFEQGPSFVLLAPTPRTMSLQPDARMISPTGVDSDDSAWGDISIFMRIGVLGENGGIGRRGGGVGVAGSCRGIFGGIHERQGVRETQDKVRKGG